MHKHSCTAIGVDNHAKGSRQVIADSLSVATVLTAVRVTGVLRLCGVVALLVRPHVTCNGVSVTSLK